MKLQDLQLSRYRFCAEKTRQENEDFLWQKFKTLLKAEVVEIGGFDNTSQKSIERKTAKTGYFVPIITSIDNSTQNNQSNIVFYKGFYRTLISGSFLDVFVLQQWVGLEEKFTEISQLLKTAEKLKEQLYTYDKIETELPAECFCYFTEFQTSETETKEIFSTLLETENFTAIELDFAHLAIDFGEEKAVAAIISKSFADTKAKDKASKLLDVLLREYFLSVAKVKFGNENIKELDAKSVRQNLLNNLADLKKNQPKTLGEIESANRDLTKYRVDLAEKIKITEYHLHTIEINIGNAERILNNPLLQTKKSDLQKMLINPLTLQADQIKADITYLKIDEEKAKIIAEEIANLSNLQAGIYGRKLAWLFGLFSLIGAFQLFKGFTDWNDTTAKIFILGAIILIPCWILFANDIKDYIFGTDDNHIQPTENKQIIQNKTVRRELSPKGANDEIAEMKAKKETLTK